MTRKQLCEMCTEYSTEVACENRESCELQKILAENETLRAENKKLHKENEEMRIDKSWEKFPEMMGK